MKKIILIFTVFLLINASNSIGKEYRNHIVKLKTTKDSEQLQYRKFQLKKIFTDNTGKSDNLQSKNELEKFYVLQGYDELSDNDKRELNSKIEFIEPNYIFKIEQDNTKTNDALINEQWGLEAVNAFNAWKIATGKGIKIGLVDTGIDFKHQDLENNIFINSKEDINNNGKFDDWRSTEIRNGVSGDLDGIDNDGNGTVDDVIGYDFVDTDSGNIGDSKDIDPVVSDEHGHGTAVAGVICATANNNLGISGVAYNSKILTARAFNIFGEAESDDIAKAIVYLVNNKVKVINCSFGDNNYSRLADAAIEYAHSAGCIVVTSSGNNNWDRMHYPSDHAKVICVGGVERGDKKIQKYAYSNYGLNLTLLAPGKDILSTKAGGGYKEYSGTSLATPFVTGAVAMLLEKNPNLKLEEVKSIMEVNAQPLSGLEANEKEGAGLLDIHKSLVDDYPSNINVTTPDEFTSFKLGKDSNIVITGTVSTPLFDRYEISMENYYLNQGVDKTYPIISSASQIFNDTLGTFKNVGRSLIQNSKGQIIDLPNGDVLIRLKVFLKNGKTIQRSRLTEIVNNEKLMLNSITYSIAYDRNLKKIYVNIRTNLNSYVSVKPQESTVINDYNDDIDLYSKYHTLILNPYVKSDGQYSYNVKITRRDGQQIDTSILIKADFDDFANTSCITKPYSIESKSYLTNDIRDINGDGSPDIITNNITDDYKFNKTQLYSFTNNKFLKQEEYPDALFQMSIGNTNNNRFKDVLFKQNGRTVLYESKNQLFSNKIYDDYASTGMYLYDIDRDGIDEVVAFKANTNFKDTGIKDSLIISKYQGDSYFQYLSYSLNESEKEVGEYNSATKLLIDDFDNDGKPEVAIVNKYGSLKIIKIDKSKFNTEFISKDTTYTEAFQLAKGDIDGDGQQEILKLTDYLINSEADYEYPTQPSKRVCKLQIYKYRNGRYEELENLAQSFINSKTSYDHTEYKFGVSCGDIDNKKGDEIIVTLFPNLFVFKYTQDKLKPYFYANDSYSNNAVVADFDKNGVNELGYSTDNAVKFIEIDTFSTDIVPPTRIWGYSLDTNRYLINWVNPVNSQKTEIWIKSNGKDSLQGVISGDKYILTDYPDKQGGVYLKSIYDENKVSPPSKEIMFNIYPANKVTNTDFVDNIIIVKYAEKVPLNIQPGYFSVINSQNKELKIKSVLYLSETEYLIVLNEKLNDGDYTLNIESFFDYFSNLTQAFSKKIKFTLADRDRFLYFKKLKVVSKEPPVIELQFSDKIGESALDKDNYTLEPKFSIQSINIKPDNDSIVVIEFDEAAGLGALGHTYSISSNMIISVNQVKMQEGKANKLSFVFVGEDINNTFVYPNPADFSKDEFLYFANLPVRAIIKIYTLDGVLLNTITENDGNGGTQWDGTDNKGSRLNTGVYLYQAEDMQGNKSELMKLVIIK